MPSRALARVGMLRSGQMPACLPDAVRRESMAHRQPNCFPIASKATSSRHTATTRISSDYRRMITREPTERMSYTSSTSLALKRMQPRDSAAPMLPASFVPWMPR